MTRDLAAALRTQAHALGFDAIGITRPGTIGMAGDRLAAFLAQGFHGEMDWLARDPARRAHPQNLWGDVQSIVMLGVNYGPDQDPMVLRQAPERAAISVYAQGADYHDVIKKRLKALARWLIAQAGGDVKVFVDTAAVMEKPLAQAAALGWQGKHTNLVSRDFGSWLFLGAIFTTLELPADTPERDHCGSCRNCLDICPTNAFPAPYQLDARRCISYLTIELKGHVPHEFRAAIGNRIYGCDDCLAVCPWNKFAQAARESAFHPRESLNAATLVTLSKLDDAQFRAMFSASPVKRIGRNRFIRNVAIALGNTGRAAADGEETCAALIPLLYDASPLVRAAAVWAYRRCASTQAFDAAAQEYGSNEQDAQVRAEWRGEAPQNP